MVSVRRVVPVLLLAVAIPIFGAPKKSSSHPPRDLHRAGDHWTAYNPPDPATWPAGSKSYTIKAGDTLSVKESSRGSNYFKEAVNWAKTQTRPGWLETDPEAFTARVLALPTRDQIEAQVNTQLIVEHYSR